MLESNFEYGPPETSERYTSYPATADGLGLQVSDTEWETVWEGVAVPSPEREIVAGEFVALLVTVTVPGKLPAASGRERRIQRCGLPRRQNQAGGNTAHGIARVRNADLRYRDIGISGIRQGDAQSAAFSDGYVSEIQTGGARREESRGRHSRSAQGNRARRTGEVTHDGNIARQGSGRFGRKNDVKCGLFSRANHERKRNTLDRDSGRRGTRLRNRKVSNRRYSIS